MPSSEVRYQRGDHYRPFDEDILRARRSSSNSTSSGSKAKRPANGFAPTTSNPKVTTELSPALRYGPPHEYLTKKKVEVKTTKNTERRVQRCIVLEDGRIIEHDDPHVMVDTVEDTQTHEFDHLEDKQLAKELQASIERSYRKAGLSEAAEAAHRHRRKSIAYNAAKKEAAATAAKHNDMISRNEDDAGSLVNDTFKRIVNTHDVKENIVRTHAAKDLGMISKRGLRKVLKKEGKVSDYLEQPDNSTSNVDDRGSNYRQQQQRHQQQRRHHRKNHQHHADANANASNTSGGHHSPSAENNSKNNNNKNTSGNNNKAVVRSYQTESHKRIVDTQDIHEISRRMKDGQVKTETIKTETHEIFDDKAAPDESKNGSGSSETEHDRDEQKFHLSKKQEFTDYYDTRGNLVLNGPNTISKDTKVVVNNEGLRHFDQWAEVTDDRVRQARNSMKKRLKPSEDAERKDALTKRPLDLNKEEKTRKKETNKWLDRHFGSDWSLVAPHDIISASNAHANANNTNGSGIRGGTGGGFKYLNTEQYDSSSQFDPHRVRRTMSFSSIPIHYTNPGEKVSRVIKQTTTTIKPGFDKHVVSSITKSMAPKDQPQQQQDNNRRHRSLDFANAGGPERPYHSTLTLNTNHAEAEAKKKHYASTNNLAQETSRLTLRKVPITRVIDTPIGGQQQKQQAEATQSSTPFRALSPKTMPKTRVQRLIDEKRSQSGSYKSGNSASRNRLKDPHHRLSYYYGEDLHTRVHSAPPNRPLARPMKEESHYDSSSYLRKVEKQRSQQEVSRHRRPAGGAPLYRTELLKTSNRMSSPICYDNEDESESVINRRNWRHELSKSYNDISKPIELSRTVSAMQAYKDKTQSVYDLPKPSRLFGWTDEFNFQSYDGLRGQERSDGFRTNTLHHPCDKVVKRSKSFAVGGTSSDKSSTSEDLLGDRLRGGHIQTKSYKQTKVSSPPKMSPPSDHFFPPGGGNLEIPIAPPKEFAGLSPDIQQHYDDAKRQLRQHPKKLKKKHRMSPSANSPNTGIGGSSLSPQSVLQQQHHPGASAGHHPGASVASTADAVYEFERKIPMQSSILEAQKFKTVIFIN